MAQEEPPWSMNNVQALVTRFLLKDKHTRGAAPAGPYVHAEMCVLACACIVFLMMIFTFCRNLARKNRKRA